MRSNQQILQELNTEYVQLQRKIIDLEWFIDTSSIFNNFDEKMKQVMIEQSKYMNQYSNTLKGRARLLQLQK